MIDIHCHILWGVDDGPETFEESVAMCRKAAADGLSIIVASPHQGNGVYTVPAEEIFKKTAELNGAIEKEGLKIKILPGHENHIYPGLTDDILNGKSLTINNNKKYVLIEIPVDSVPFYVEAFIAKMNEKNITSIISHPERNTHIQSNIQILKNLVQKGALTELTAMSLTGEFGAKTQAVSIEMLKTGLVHTIASDAHSLNRRPPLLSKAAEIARKVVGEELAHGMVVDTPHEIVTEK